MDYLWIFLLVTIVSLGSAITTRVSGTVISFCTIQLSWVLSGLLVRLLSIFYVSFRDVSPPIYLCTAKRHYIITCTWVRNILVLFPGNVAILLWQTLFTLRRCATFNFRCYRNTVRPMFVLFLRQLFTYNSHSFFPSTSFRALEIEFQFSAILSATVAALLAVFFCFLIIVQLLLLHSVMASVTFVNTHKTCVSIIYQL